jgi:hypothetical protein
MFVCDRQVVTTTSTGWSRILAPRLRERHAFDQRFRAFRASILGRLLASQVAFDESDPGIRAFLTFLHSAKRSHRERDTRLIL